MFLAPPLLALLPPQALRRHTLETRVRSKTEAFMTPLLDRRPMVSTKRPTLYSGAWSIPARSRTDRSRRALKRCHPVDKRWSGNEKRDSLCSKICGAYGPFYRSFLEQCSETAYNQRGQSGLRAYARSPVRNCASPFPKLQSAEEFSMMHIITSLGAIETELESSCINSL